MSRFMLIALLCVCSSALRAQSPRGDVDLNGQLEITDSIRTLSHLFVASVDDFPCDSIADASRDGQVNITDPIVVLSHLFLGAQSPGFLSEFEERICFPPSVEAVEAGMTVYENPDPDGNTFACVTCHQLVPDADADLRRPGHSLNDALGRESYKNGQIEHFLTAANVCREDWMITEPWDEEDSNFLNLVSLLREFGSSGPADPLEFEIVEPAVEGPSAGDAETGCELFHSTCVVCHGNGALGTERAPSLVFDPNNGLDPDYIRQRVRLSGNPNSVYPDLTGGVMPFWSADKISDLELEDLVAYITTRPVPVCVDIEPPPEEIVLRSGEFATLSNGVMGKVEELESRKIRLVDFDFDGMGDDVRIWLYREDDVAGGLSVGINLMRDGGWSNAELLAELPEGVSMDQFDRVAIRSIADGALYATCELESVTGVGEGIVLRSGELITRFHRVTGTVEELDTRKIRIRDFGFDGAGIDVRVWLYRAGSEQSGYQIGPSLLRNSPGWNGETIVVDIPEEITSDMYDSVSVWCVPVRVSFGDTRISAP